MRISKWAFGLCAAALSVLNPANARPAGSERVIPAQSARQGVASDGTSIYAIDNNVITRIAIADRQVTGEWRGDPALFPHLNSCTVVEDELVCASSNYPAVPQLSTVEIFDLQSLEHSRSIALGPMPGSLTALDRHDGRWWATFANYDDRGTPQGRDHRDSFVAQMDDDFRISRMWGLPDAVLDRLAPSSISGASWSENGQLYLSGHDKPELYVVALPQAGGTLRHVATIPIESHGQAIDVDPLDQTLIWSIDRETRTVHASRLPAPAD
ncbi:hypothetical protein [Croceicoccus marinus]|jgi:hypothetical protein|uniref:Uncharacterized protein n=1 Tax=Croceicoccus marinus TaxID=450378 RepID=A0A7G6VXF3_9SPHN|nr:hypothetical protein [Croceicoccus marinus]QNE06418.1 hypothetical protein H4O24_07470 [Croceicoccus marinus]